MRYVDICEPFGGNLIGVLIVMALGAFLQFYDDIYFRF
jgi:hypothetical protein